VKAQLDEVQRTAQVHGCYPVADMLSFGMTCCQVMMDANLALQLQSARGQADIMDTLEQEGKAVFMEADTNNDGNLSYNELVAFIRKQRDNKLSRYFAKLLDGVPMSERKAKVESFCQEVAMLDGVARTSKGEWHISQLEFAHGYARVMSKMSKLDLHSLAPEVLALCNGALDPFNFLMRKQQHRDLYLCGQLCLHMHAALASEARPEQMDPETSLEARGVTSAKLVMSDEARLKSILTILHLQ